MSAADQRPALLGGTPVRPEGPPPWPFPDEHIRHALEAAYQDGSWGKYHGGHVERLEKRLALDHGVEFALTCGSGTFAVEVALRALKIEPGDEVILSAYDYPGNFLAVHAVGATPVLVDVDPQSWNLDPNRLTAARSPATRVVIASHLHGGVVPMAALTELAAAHSLKVIEDAAQAPGALVQGRFAGTWGDVGILSFGGSKLLTAGRGGALLTRHADVYQRARLHQYRGNLVCPLSELQAAVLLPQLDQLVRRNLERRQSVVRLAGLLTGVPGVRLFATPLSHTEPAYYKLGIQLDERAFGLPRDCFVAAVRAEGVAVDEGFRAFRVGRSARRFRAAGDLAEAERAHHGTVVLHHPVLLEGGAAVDQVDLAIRKVHAHAAALRSP